MSSYNSLQYRHEKPTSSINLAYIDATLKDKQNTIDTNLGMLQGTIDKTLGQDLVRKEDQQMLREKVSGVLHSLENTDSIRFGQKKTRFSIQNSLYEAANDPEVLKQLSNTKKVRDAQKFYEERAKKGDLNQNNYMYAYSKAGIEDYLAGGDGNVGSFRYQEYRDVDAKIAKVAEELKAANPNELVTLTGPDGITRTQKVSQLTEMELRQHLTMQLDDDDRAQLRIDGAMRYGMDNAAALEFKNEAIAEREKLYDDKIKDKKDLIANSSPSPEAQKEIEKEIESLVNAKAQVKTGLIRGKTAEEIGYHQLLDDRVGYYAKLYSKDGPMSIEYSETSKKATDRMNANADEGAYGDISIIPITNDLKTGLTPYDDYTNLNTKLQQNGQELKQAFSELNPAKQKIYRDTEAKLLKNKGFMDQFPEGISNQALQLAVLNELGTDGKINIFTPEQLNIVRKNIQDTNTILEDQEKMMDSFVKSKVASGATFKQVFKEETKLTMITKDGREVNIQRFLRDKIGITDEESYKRFVSGDTEDAKMFRATIALQSIDITPDASIVAGILSVSSRMLPGIPSISSPLEAMGLSSSTSTMNLSNWEVQILRDAAIDLTGASLEKTHKVTKTSNGYTVTAKDSNSKLARLLQKTQDLRSLGRGPIDQGYLFGVIGTSVTGDTDRTAGNESSISDQFSEKQFKEHVENNSNLISKSHKINNAIRIQGDLKKNVNGVYQEVLKYMTNPNSIDLTGSIDIYQKDQNSPLEIFQTKEKQIWSEKNKIYEKKSETVKGEISTESLRNMPEFNRYINLTRKEDSYESIGQLQKQMGSISFIKSYYGEDEDRTVPNSYSRLLEGTPFKELGFVNEARSLLFNESANTELNKHPDGIKIKNQFDDFIRNSDKYKLSLGQNSRGDYQIDVLGKDGKPLSEMGADGKPLGSPIILDDKMDYETFAKIYRGAPQVFLSLYTAQQINNYRKKLAPQR